ncbi:conserved hypothetical protein [Burkholderia cenocepacia]|uniref:hypothetical protein n=1 Tax=Burkholderia cenocepacia TaxID=95486 RepID=UPI00192B5FC8|nr:hypothetical protein [Burkholderia cenocepacia]CAD9227898.1 conserved hypothetical protein [Burkholderia cenocepacia]
MDDLIQQTFAEIKSLHAELQGSDKYLDYLIEMNKKAERLQNLISALHTLLNYQGKTEEDYFEEDPSFFYMSATQENESQPIWTVTDHSYIYCEEDIVEMEKLYLSCILNRDLPESSTTSKKTKI